LLTQLDDETLRAELAGSRADLEAGLGLPVRSVCYPNGDADDRVSRLAATVGYTGGVTVERGINPPGFDALRLRRRSIDEERLRGLLGPASRHLLRAELTGVADFLFLRERRSPRGKSGSAPWVAGRPDTTGRR
jgi:peptidoglycan/xylan/chitin deacetylase (PgdA/CDA1 family)